MSRQSWALTLRKSQRGADPAQLSRVEECQRCPGPKEVGVERISTLRNVTLQREAAWSDRTSAKLCGKITPAENSWER